MKMTAEDIAYLRQAAARDGYNPEDAIKVFNYESSLRPDVWGGKGGKYYGIFQAGPSERAQFGIDTKNPSARNQIDAFGKFLSARGFKPGMGLMDLYSTVLAGSPGHYNRTDGAGTVSQHVAKMMGGQPVAAMVSAPSPSATETTGSNAPETINDLLLQQPTAPRRTFGGLLSALPTAMTEDEPAYDDEMKQQMNDFHRQMHEAAVAGLLGRN